MLSWSSSTLGFLCPVRATSSLSDHLSAIVLSKRYWIIIIFCVMSWLYRGSLSSFMQLRILFSQLSLLLFYSYIAFYIIYLLKNLSSKGTILSSLKVYLMDKYLYQYLSYSHLNKNTSYYRLLTMILYFYVKGLNFYY